jgi:hypothetical protein
MAKAGVKIQRTPRFLDGLAFDGAGVDHGGADVAVAEQLLDGADVAVGLQQVGGKAVAAGVARDALADPRLSHRFLEFLLHMALMKMVAPVFV